jgi:hypothetical protein
MSRRLPKSLIASFVSLVLLYYSAAWAVLRCLQDDLSDTSVTTSENGGRPADSYVPFPIDAPASLECIGYDYHAESLAGPSSSPQLPRWAVRIISHVTDFSFLDGIVAVGARGLWLRAVFDRFASPTFPIDLPRYLCLSVLRI